MMLRSLLFCIAAVCASAQTFEVPPKPERFVLDQGYLYSVAKDDLRELEQMLLDFKSEHDLELYVVIAGGITGEITLKNRAQILYREWIGSDPRQAGVIAMFDIDSEYLELGTYIDETDNPLDDPIRPRLTEADLQAAYSLAGNAAIGISDKREFIASFVEQFGDKIVAEIGPNEPPAIDSYLWRNVLYILAALLVLGLIAFALARRTVRRASARDTLYYFPEAHSPTRLGAPFGAGASDVVEF